MTMHNQQERQASIATALLSHLPHDFLWGASTSAYQIEGATHEDGRGSSIWDDFSATPGKTYQGETGEIADEHYYRSAEDIALMSDMGLKAYCFSLSWSRILPQGTGTVNMAGLDFYDRLVDTLLARGISPLAKLYHWDLPSALQARGGWQQRATALAFADYADLVTRRLGDRVQNWMTHNEPYCISYLGHTLGVHAPGLTSAQAGMDASHHVLLSHGLAVPCIRANVPRARVGIAIDYYPIYGVDEQASTELAVEQADVYRNRWFFDPVFKGSYPNGLFECLGVQPPPIQEGDLAIMATPIDFLGLNYYSRMLVRHKDDTAASNGNSSHTGQIFEQIASPAGSTFTDMPWEIFPQGLLKALQRIHHDYAPPAIYITESGAAFDDILEDAPPHVHDERRTAYLRGHIESIAQAVAQGIPVQGYFAWSLLDNYEWSLGYSKRFGLIYVDFATQQRTVKDSGTWYSQLIAAHGDIGTGQA